MPSFQKIHKLYLCNTCTNEDYFGKVSKILAKFKKVFNIKEFLICVLLNIK